MTVNQSALDAVMKICRTPEEVEADEMEARKKAEAALAAATAQPPPNPLLAPCKDAIAALATLVANASNNSRREEAEAARSIAERLDEAVRATEAAQGIG